jgi:ATP-dependent DNA helicase DinG
LSKLADEVSSWFKQCSRASADFSYRASQHDLAVKIATALDTTSSLVAEAGTGIGKTLAYLIPILFSTKKVIIATGTKHLQDQIITKDIPKLRQVLAFTKRVEVLKGRANYLCLYRTQQLSLSDDFFEPKNLHDLSTIKAWQGKLKRGDIAEIPGIADDAAIWPLVTSTSDNCLGKECPSFNSCYLVKARRDAVKADTLIINHHLFFADLVMKEEGFADILPAFDAVIFDEAHQVAEVAAHFLGANVSSRQLIYLVQEAGRAAQEFADHDTELLTTASRLQEAVDDLQIQLRLHPSRGSWRDIKQDVRSMKTFSQLIAALEDFILHLQALQERHQEFVTLQHRASKFKGLLEDFMTEPSNTVLWYEVYRKSFIFHQTPIDVAPRLKPLFAEPRSWIFTSATLSVNGSTQHFQTALGLNIDSVEQLESPFDYRRQALLYLPGHLPEPRHKDFIAAFVRAAIPVINAARGRTFILVTSHRALAEVEALLSPAISYPLLCQGSVSKHTLIEQFIAAGEAVLLGTSSFWEGVDVKGDALSCVIIEKLPFAAPNDPITQARLASLQARGLVPFYDYQLPKAVLQLRQGVGRLIRDSADRGILMIADNRLMHRPYGKIFWQSLPNMPVTRRLDTVIKFLEQHENTGA